MNVHMYHVLYMNAILNLGQLKANY